MKAIRLQKFIADCGVTSRRKAEELIVQGRVEVNGELITLLGTKVNPSHDVVSLDGEHLELGKVEKIYTVLNKPRGCITTTHDPEGRKTVLDYMSDVTERIYPVGRLDYLSEGLLIMTNDGELANIIMHPSYEVIKVYEVKVFGAVTAGILKKLRDGVQLEDGFAKPKSVRVIKQLQNKTWLEFRLNEGKNREIRKICEACGLTVDKLKRVSIGGLSTNNLSPGSWLYFTKKQLLDAIGIREKDGMINVMQKEYISDKKSINLKKKGAQPATAADDQSFRVYRKESYFDTIKGINERKEREAAEKTQAMFAAKEEAHQERVNKKRARVRKKREAAKGAHAEFVKS